MLCNLYIGLRKILSGNQTIKSLNFLFFSPIRCLIEIDLHKKRFCSSNIIKYLTYLDLIGTNDPKTVCNQSIGGVYIGYSKNS